MVNQSKLRQLLPESSILAGYRGSISHGTYREGYSDTDVLSIHVGPVEHYLGFRRKGQETFQKFEGEADIVSHEVRKFCDLLLGGNPNVVSLLWLPDHMMIQRTPIGYKLRNNRDLFASKRFYKAFRGYARSLKERLFRETYEGFAADKRAEDREEYGYDTKEAAECIRVLYTGIEFLERGLITYPRPERDFLMEIKNGEVPLDEIKFNIDALEGGLDLAHKNSLLPERADRDEVEKLLMDVIRTYHFEWRQNE